MSIKVTLAAVLADAAGSTRNMEIEGNTVGEVLRNLSGQYKKLTPLLWRKKTGEVNPMLVIFLNDEDIRSMERLETPVKPGDKLAVIAALEGGR